MRRNCWSSAQYPRPNGYARMSGLVSVISVYTAAEGGLVLDSRRTNTERASDLALDILEVDKFQ